MTNTPKHLSNKNSVDNLIFLEFIDETKILLRKYLKDIQTAPDKFQIISFHPSVKAHLLGHNIPSVDSFHFCSTESYRKLLIKFEEYMEEVRSQCKINEGVEKSYIENFLFLFRYVLSHWLYQVEVITNAIEQYKPQAVIGIGPIEVNDDWSLLCVEKTERYITNIVNQICFQKRIIFKNIPMKIKLHRSETRKPRYLEGILKKIAKNFLCWWCNKWHSARGVKKKRLIFVTHLGHNMISVINDLKNELPDIYVIALQDYPFYDKESLKYFIKTFFNRSYIHLPFNRDKGCPLSQNFIKQRDVLRNNLCKIIDGWNYHGISLRWLKKKYLHTIEHEVIDKTYYRAVNMNKYLDEWKPIFEISQYSRFWTAVTGELCKRKQIPSLMIPHGGAYTSIPDEYSKREWKENALGIVNTLYKYLALQTPLIEKFLKDVPTESIPVRTGPLILGRKREKDDYIKKLRRQYASDDGKIILHATTPKLRIGRRLYIHETIDEYIDGISSLIKAVDGIKGVHLIIRYRVIDDLKIEELKDILPKSNSYSISSDGNFIDYRSIADLLVSYYSSTIGEALLNNIPVLLYNKYNRYQHMKGLELSSELTNPAPSAVYNVNSEKNLSFAIEWILKNHLARKDSLDYLYDEYKYQTHETIKLSKFIEDLQKQELIK